jgi:hypothetical protein
LIGTLGFGTTTTPTASVTGGVLLSNATQPSQLRKWFAFAGSSVDLGPAGGEEVSVGRDSCGRLIWVNESEAGVGAAAPLPVEVHEGASYTWAYSP